MLSLLKQTAVHILATGSDDGCEIEEWQDEAIVTLAVNDFHALVPAWSGISWPNLPSMVDVCTKTLVPVCRAVQQTLQDDIDQLAHILVELDPSALDDCEENPISEVSQWR
ncbi:hypothetical protein PHLCEN_2v2861 [Hermanssonia centrifuga]|uniref:Uncharacterized protein n=1 Tax=Hermanssonia centrifuga TaxID=98765 RepID=A0A2R6RI73_9APHY|nr:hypothetical protein PHLCEN_2v2861 [Hermanssonia centrifuga]